MKDQHLRIHHFIINVEEKSLGVIICHNHATQSVPDTV